MIIDFLSINIINIYLATIILSILNLNEKKLYFILIIDIILNNFPIITIIIIIFYIFKNLVFKYINENIISKMLLLTIYYFIFGIIIYGTHNKLNLYIFNYLLRYLIINLIIYFIGIKYLNSKYN